MSLPRSRRSLLVGSMLVLSLIAAACAGGDALDPDAGTPDDAEEAPADDPADDAEGADDTEDADAAEPGSIVVGSANFPESVMLANMYALALEEIGMEVTTRTNIGAREVYFPALQQGDIDLLPEYTGSLLAFVAEDDVEETETEALVAQLREQLEPEVQILEPSEAENRNGWAVRQDTAEEFGLETMSDLAEVGDQLVAGGAPETRERPDGLPGLEEVYGFQFEEFLDLDPGGPLTAQALEGGDIDVARVFTSQGVIAANDWVVLEDDQGLFPAENLIPVIREDALTDEIRETLNAVSAALTLEELTELNRRVEVENEDPDLVAEDWLVEQGLYSA
jgi:osmoprotectant transport system substrate-binding protein